ncbi:hypothetical protein QUF74_10095 [Candidatus Halobeggiatoa sp. HSG11]|nr:hypothetical protein [Candidatus Halobeggiatoa sp. HSG11]
MLAEEIVKEISLIPATKLQEVYELIHYFRIGIEQSHQVNQNNLSTPRQAGILKGKLGEAFFEPLPEEESKI